LNPPEPEGFLFKVKVYLLLMSDFEISFLRRKNQIDKILQDAMEFFNPCDYNRMDYYDEVVGEFYELLRDFYPEIKNWLQSISNEDHIFILDFYEPKIHMYWNKKCVDLNEPLNEGIDFIINESQLEKLTEIWVGRGKLRRNEPSYELIFQEVDSEVLVNRVLRKAIKEYFKKVLGKELSQDKIEYLSNNLNKYKEIPELKNEDVRSNLAYFLAKKFLKVKSLGNLEYVVVLGGVWSFTYVFFDPELEISIGYISVKESGHLAGEIINNVGLSAVDNKLIGRGFGKEMYLALLDKYKILGSDDSLYSESLNIWVNVLPKFTNVFAHLTGGGYVPIIPGKTPPKPENVERYYATNSDKIVKKFLGRG
jgi:hypothetical protein